MTIEIADDFFKRVQRIAKKEKIPLSSLVEQGLRLVLNEKQGKAVVPLKQRPNQ